MEMKQIYEILNDVNKEVLGDSVILQEDLGNIVDVGSEIFDNNSFDHYCKSLVDKVGRVVFVNRKYSGRVPSILREGWEFGAVLQKLACELPEAQENESWKLENNQSYDPNIFKAPTVTSHFWNKRTTFEVQMSFAEEQVKSAFTSAEDVMAFVSMIYNAIDMRLTIDTDALVMRTINNLVAETVYDDFGANSISGGSHEKAVNVLYLYNQTVDVADQLTAATCMESPAFLRFAAALIGMYIDRMAVANTMYNIDGKVRFTPKDLLNVVVLSEFENKLKTNLQSDTFHDELVSLPKHDTVPFFQDPGDYTLPNAGKIYVTTASNHSVTVTGILAVMFDRDAAVVANMNRRTTSQYNAKGEFTNNFFKQDCGYLNSFQEQAVVFFAA